MTVTLKDIADAAGVYPSAVSAVLNNKNYTRVSPERRARIQALADQLGYRPNPQAVSLRKKTRPTVGVFLPEWRNGLLMELVMGLSAEAAEYDLPLALHFGINLNDYARFIKSMTSSRNSGIISYVLFGQPSYAETIDLLEKYLNGGGKLVMLSPWDIQLPEAFVLKMNEHLGGELAAGELVERQCRSLATFYFDRTLFAQRVAGFCEVAAAASIPATAISLGMQHLPHRERLAAELERLLAGRRDKIGIFAASGTLCDWIYEQCRQSGLVYGVDFEMVGYDREPQVGMIYSIPRIVQPFEDFGRLAMKKLFAGLSGHDCDVEVLDPVLQLPNY